VVPPQNNAPVSVRGAKILAQVGEELAFVEAGKDIGLLPINSLLMDFEELPRDGAPAVLATGLTAARTLLDQILDGPGIFTVESIRFLNDWHSWMSSVLTAWERGVNACGNSSRSMSSGMGQAQGPGVIIVFEGPHAAGKGGTIRALTERLSPRVFRTIALPAPSRPWRMWWDSFQKTG
jgi:hypothetical protein